MAAQPDPGSSPTRPRATWLVLARDGPAIRLADVALPSARVHTVDDPSAFIELLAAQRPRIAILAEPPASDAALRMVISERRRRTGLRAIHSVRLATSRHAWPPCATASTRRSRRPSDRGSWPRERPSSRIARGRHRLALQLGNGYELDLVAHALLREGRPIHLRPKEFALLAMLAAHPGRAYTRRQLLDRVWGSEQASQPRTVDVHVRWLRAKIEAQPDRPVRLVTVRGVGYRLDCPLTDP
jgi:DNA-binding response OmpR family regulator